MAIKPNPLQPVVLNVVKTIKAGLTNFLQNTCRVSIGNTTLTAGTGQWVTAVSYPTLITDTGSDTYAWCQSFFAKNATGRAFILECKPPDVSKKASEILQAYIESGSERMYTYSLPVSMYTELTTDTNLVTLVNKFLSFEASQYFAFDIPVDDTIIAVDSPFQKIKGLKSVMGIRMSEIGSESISGALCGIISSSVYRLSSVNRLNILQWKSVDGVITPDDKIESEFLTAYNDNGITYVSTLAGIVCVLGCSMADGTQWSEYYAVDNLLFDLKNNVTAMFINGSNNNNMRVTFDQSGVSLLINTVNATTNNNIVKGCVSAFGTGLDDAGNIIGVGSWAFIPFAEWRKDNTENYKARIYDGASVVVETTKFMLQVVLNIQLN